MYLLIDCETTGLPDFNKRARDPSQPHIVQMAMLMTDENGALIKHYNKLAKPDGWTIPPELTQIHGISNERALAEGIDEKEMLATALQWIKSSKMLIAYNLTFDKFIVRCGLRRFDLMQDADDAWWKALPTYCVMKPMTDICKLPGKRPGQYKFPKLQEAYKQAFGKEFSGEHNAALDLEATYELWRWQMANIKT